MISQSNLEVVECKLEGIRGILLSALSCFVSLVGQAFWNVSFKAGMLAETRCNIYDLMMGVLLTAPFIAMLVTF